MYASNNYQNFVFAKQVEGRKLLSDVNLFNQFPQILRSVSDIEKVVAFVDHCELCWGQNEERFLTYIQLKKGKIMNQSGE